MRVKPRERARGREEEGVDERGVVAHLEFSGDHVLPTITPHIGGISPEKDPLAKFFESLKKMTTFEGVSIALPAHGHPFVDLGGRAIEIIEHHEERLETIRKTALTLPDGSVTEFMKVLFSERAWGDMAESETYAHLEHLRELGELHKTEDEGISRYSKEKGPRKAL